MRKVPRRVITILFGMMCSICAAEKLPDDVQQKVNFIQSKMKVKDFDGNGRINCCDRATAFAKAFWFEYYPKQGEYCVLMIQQTKKLNHMYVKIKIGNRSYCIDPVYKVNGSSSMEDVWDDRYDYYAGTSDNYWVYYFEKYILE